MNRNQFERMTGANQRQTISARMLPVDKTLLVGYTCARETFHVYSWNGVLHVVTLNGSDIVISHLASATLRPEQLVPDKRVYAEYTDYRLANMLKDKGIELPYTTWDDKRYQRVSLEDPFVMNGCECGMTRGQHHGFGSDKI
jgi:hypothetical protein